MTYLDTHVVVWLYAGMEKRFRGRARKKLDRDELRVSPMVSLEIDFLREIGRVTASGDTMIADLRLRSRLSLCPLPFATVVKHASELDWTRDPFDRMIVAQAAAAGAALLTHDGNILDHYGKAIWD